MACPKENSDKKALFRNLEINEEEEPDLYFFDDNFLLKTELKTYLDQTLGNKRELTNTTVVPQRSTLTARDLDDDKKF
eukprot:CAMPEP_0170563598 /NCGR_PEP_ID=MMETSP0211-20121228/67636_1 /TAXON_ID=311385 /ORGANISM="Pseudokeronopsis sp., Strain OXSARD2" /LENGTH=77 /DNA_ID=CAMNT_0010882019 /DNA_START=1170 /DNA_END=1400 /DNA_ORIENTATION=+